jgi:type IV pilus assembly protein PilW
MAESVPLATNPNTTTLTIAADNNRFDSGQILLVTDCDNASVFQASAVTTAGTVTTILHTAGGMTPGNSAGNISNLYGNDAEIGRLQTSMFNIENGANGRPALFERSLVVTGSTTAALARNELIQNVENMQIVYGVDADADGDTDSYESAATVDAANWGKVISVHIALLLTSEENNLVSAGETWTYNAATHTYDKTVAGTNRRFRRVVTCLIALRNRSTEPG